MKITINDVSMIFFQEQLEGEIIQQGKSKCTTHTHTINTLYFYEMFEPKCSIAVQVMLQTQIK